MRNRNQFHPYKKLAEMICDRFILKGSPPKMASEVNALCMHRKNCVRDYYVSKAADTLLTASVMAVFVTVILVSSAMKDRSIPSGTIARPGYGENDTDEELNLSVSGRKDSSMTVHISSRKFTSKEVKKILKAADDQLMEEVTGDNPSLNEVQSSLSFPKTLQNGLVSAEYSVRPSGMIDDDTGEITGRPDSAGTPVTVEVTLRLQEKERISKFSAILFPPVLAGEEKFQADLDDALKRADEKDPTAESIRLPSKAGSDRLFWSRPESSLLTVLVFLGLLLPVIVWIQKDEKTKEQAKNRRERLDLDYSELLFKLTLLIGAGLTIRGAFMRVCAQAESSSSSPDTAHPVYGEIRVMLREISSGIPEETAYENFGRRCELPHYIKLGSLLAQNLRKGSRGLTSLLEKEAFLSLQQHRTAARKLGEKASMKMLFPMILMFTDVMIILMVPALMSI